eukprot:600987_1
MATYISFGILFCIASIVFSCSPFVRNVYIDDLSLLASDEDSVLLHIRNDRRDTSWCKILNVSTGDLSEIVSCNAYSTDVMEWMQGDIDPTSSQIMNASPSSNEIVMQRNNETFNILLSNIDVIEIVKQYDPVYPLYSWTLSSIYTTFVVLSHDGYSVIDDTIAVVFANANSNSIAGVYKVNISQQFEWFELDTNGETIVDVFEQYHVIRYPLHCCICSTFAASYYDITKVNDDVIEMDLTVINDGRIDTRNGRIYDVFLFAISVTIYDSHDSATTFDFDTSQLSDALTIKCTYLYVLT